MEEKLKKEKRYKHAKVIGILSFIAIIICVCNYVIHPREYKIAILVYLSVIIGTCLINLIEKKQKKGIVVFNIVIKVLLIIGILPMLLIIGLGSGSGQRSRFEYKENIVEEKMENVKLYGFFPDTIPEGASNVKWGYNYAWVGSERNCSLVFKADDEYIKELVANNEINAKDIYHYYEDNYVSEHESDDDSDQELIDFEYNTYIDNIDENDTNCRIFKMVSSEDSVGGVCINYDDNTVCFFAAKY